MSDEQVERNTAIIMTLFLSDEKLFTEVLERHIYCDLRWVWIEMLKIVCREYERICNWQSKHYMLTWSIDYWLPDPRPLIRYDPNNHRKPGERDPGLDFADWGRISGIFIEHLNDLDYLSDPDYADGGGEV